MASLLAFALAAPQRYPAVINPQGDGVAAAASPTAVSLNSTRMYSDYLESRVQFESATYDGCGSEMAAPQGHRFLMVVDAWEQSQKSLGVVNDVAFYARALNRVLVEPGVAESRIVDPFGEATWKPWRGLGLANYWDVRPLCRYLDGRLMPLQRFVAEGGLELEKRELKGKGSEYLGSLQLESEDDVRAHFAPHADVPLLVLRRQWRSNVEGRSWNSTSRNSTRDAVPTLAIAPSITTVAEELAHALPSPFACVQWRAEGGTDRPEECAAELADAVGSWGRLSEAVVLLTDLYPGNSVTFQHAARSAGLVGRFESALRILQDRLPLGPTNAQAEQWRAVNDSGLRSMLELEVCARARLLVTCNEALVNESLAAGNQPRCTKCAKLRSGFTERVVALHKARGEGNRTAW